MKKRYEVQVHETVEKTFVYHVLAKNPVDAEFIVDSGTNTAGEALLSVIAYDDSILGRAAKGEVSLELETGKGGIAYGEDLDAIYFDMVSKAKLALKSITPDEQNSIAQAKP